MTEKNTKYIFFILVAIVLTAVGIWYSYNSESNSHPIGYADSPEEAHVHSDFVVYIGGEMYDFTDDKYQSEALSVRHEHIHLHDNNDEVIHRHKYGITLGDFFSSLGFTLTDECITTDTGETYCSSNSQQLLLFVNGQITTPISSYINQEEDRILLFYGNPEDPQIPTLLENITDTACIFSGTCPERGTAPAESCGLSCEI